MRTRGKMLALVLAGAVVLASGAYAAGTQVGGGSASAAKDDQDRPERGFVVHGGPPPGFDSLADKLGVSEEKLEDALKELRDEIGPKAPDRPKLHRGGGPGIAFGFGGDDLAKELADELGIDESKIDQALDNIREKHEAEAKKKRDELIQKLAGKLGVSPDKVKDAFEDGPFGGPPGPPPGLPRHP